MTTQNISNVIAQELNISLNQITATVNLFDEGNTIPFVARYRKEVTGGLDEVQLRQIQTRLDYLRRLTERKNSVLASIIEQDKLTPDLQQEIETATTFQRVEDLYLPFKQKRRTRGMLARERGLQPIADILLNPEKLNDAIDNVAVRFLSDDVLDVDSALAGARDIVAEMISEDASVRGGARAKMQNQGVLVVKLAKKDADPTKKYEMYHDFSAPIKDIPSHQLLAINRGEKDNVLRVSMRGPDGEIIKDIERRFIKNTRSPTIRHLQLAISDGYERLIQPSIDRETRSLLTEKSDDQAITTFATNLKSLLLQPPLKEKRVLGIDPGFRTGCKVAIVDATGKYLANTTIFPHEPQKQWPEAKRILATAIENGRVNVIAIGNGTASRETEQLVVDVIGELSNKGKDVSYAMVNEAGASVYSASPLAREEFPDLDVTVRGAVSIARRLQDPLSELVKIDPQSIGVGLYQHDVDQKKLQQTLDSVVEDAVNHVGVDVNTASAALLQYVAGIGKKLAQNIVDYRNLHGPFGSRNEIKKVKGVGSKAFEQAAGFLRVPNSKNLLDNTGIHPESYAVVKQFLELARVNLEKKDFSQQINQYLQGRKLDELAAMLNVGVPTLRDIVSALSKPGRDPREDLPPPTLRRDVLHLEDLREGMPLSGTVRNVVDFGAFVDIGVKQDGLVHLSEMGAKYVQNPHDVVKVGDVVQVWVLKIDKERNRIALTMKKR